MGRKKIGASGAAARKSRGKRVHATGRGTGTAATEGRDLALAVAAAALDRKALNVEIIDVEGKVDYTDYVVVMSGRSDRQVNGIARGIEEHLASTMKVRCLGVEGLPQGSWVLMDFGPVIVHIFHEDTRGYYDLESLWIDAARISVEPLPA